MKTSATLIIVTSLLLCFACKSENVKSKIENESKEKLIEIRVVKAMGEAINDSIDYLPLIGSMAEAKIEEQRKYPYLVLGKNISKSDGFLVKKVATLVYEHYGEEKKLFLAFPKDVEKRAFKANSFSDFATNYISVKWQIENWYNHFSGIGNSRFVRWELIND